MANLLVVEDDADLRQAVVEILSAQAHQVVEAGDVAEAIAAIEANSFDVCMVDMRLPFSGISQSVDSRAGLRVVEYATDHPSKPNCIVMTAYGSAGNLVEAVQKGAWDYIGKPFSRDLLSDCVENALRQRALEQALPEPADYQQPRLIGSSRAMMECQRLISRVAQADVDVLIQGESGTGKELVARAIHYGSVRRHAPFIPLNCAGIPSELLESELFGHRKGAFSGAIVDRAGAFAAAENGVVFLDEIGDMPFAMQAKLLRVLQEKKIRPLGTDNEISVNVRVISATNKNLDQCVRSGEFREDLFYRLNVVPITIPPLRDRKEDIPLLVAHFLDRCTRNAQPKTISDKAMARLIQCDWRGNVRELEHAVHRAAVLTEGTEVRPSDLELREPVQPESNISRWSEEPEQALVACVRRLVELGNSWNMLEDYLVAAAMSERDVDAEAAKLIGKPATTVRSKKRRMKHAIQTHLREQGRETEEIQGLMKQLGDLKTREQREKLLRNLPLHTESS